MWSSRGVPLQYYLGSKLNSRFGQSVSMYSQYICNYAKNIFSQLSQCVMLGLTSKVWILSQFSTSFHIFITCCCHVCRLRQVRSGWSRLGWCGRMVLRCNAFQTCGTIDSLQCSTSQCLWETRKINDVTDMEELVRKYWVNLINMSSCATPLVSVLYLSVFNEGIRGLWKPASANKTQYSSIWNGNYRYIQSTKSEIICGVVITPSVHFWDVIYGLVLSWRELNPIDTPAISNCCFLQPVYCCHDCSLLLSHMQWWF